MSITVIGHPLSPYVRKVLACLEYKKLNYRIDPVFAPLASEQFTVVSPLRVIPVLQDGDFTVSDSSVICQYLDDQYPESSIYPKDPQLAAKARWYEEYADTKLFEVLALKLFVHRVIRPVFRTGTPDESIVNDNLQSSLPEAFDYLESEMVEAGFILGEFCIADVALGAFFRLVKLSEFSVDKTRWPKLASYTERVLALPVFSSRFALEEGLLVLPLDDHWSIAEGFGFSVIKGY